MRSAARKLVSALGYIHQVVSVRHIFVRIGAPGDGTVLVVGFQSELLQTKKLRWTNDSQYLSFIYYGMSQALTTIMRRLTLLLSRHQIDICFFFFFPK